MLDIRHLSNQHARLIDLAQNLAGLAAHLRSRGDAMSARNVVEAIDDLLIEHLTIEDKELYPAMIATGTPEQREMATRAYEDMGGLSGAWVHFKDHWKLETILGDPVRFRSASDDIVGALSLRIEMEEQVLYPAFVSLSDQIRDLAKTA